MGKLILLEGMPGSGKSRSIKNLDANTTLVITPNGKDLPFAGSRKMYKEGENMITTSDLHTLRKTIQKANEGKKFKTIIVEDLSHYFNKRTMADMNEKGYDKWNRLAVDVFNSFLDIESSLRDDLYIVIIAHVETSRDASGNPVSSLYTPGTLLDRNIKIPSYFTYVLHADVENQDGTPHYYFLTNLDGSGREAKSPEGCLDLKEENDCATIISKIEKYQNS